MMTALMQYTDHNGDHNGLNAGVIVLLSLVGIALLVLWITALVSIARDNHLTGGGKFLWIVVIIAFPLLGSIGWFVFGKKAQLVKRGSTPPDQG